METSGQGASLTCEHRERGLSPVCLLPAACHTAPGNSSKPGTWAISLTPYPFLVLLGDSPGTQQNPQTPQHRDL